MKLISMGTMTRAKKANAKNQKRNYIMAESSKNIERMNAIKSGNIIPLGLYFSDSEPMTVEDYGEIHKFTGEDFVESLSIHKSLSESYNSIADLLKKEGSRIRSIKEYSFASYITKVTKSKAKTFTSLFLNLNDNYNPNSYTDYEVSAYGASVFDQAKMNTLKFISPLSSCSSIGDVYDT